MLDTADCVLCSSTPSGSCPFLIVKTFCLLIHADVYEEANGMRKFVKSDIFLDSPFRLSHTPLPIRQGTALSDLSYKLAQRP